MNVKEVHDLCLLCWLVDFLAIQLVHCDFNGRKACIKASFFLYIFIDLDRNWGPTRRKDVEEHKGKYCVLSISIILPYNRREEYNVVSIYSRLS